MFVCAAAGLSDTAALLWLGYILAEIHADMKESAFICVHLRFDDARKGVTRQP